MSNCEQLHHGCRKYVYLTRFALLDNLLLGRQRGGKASFESLAADSHYPVKIFPGLSATGAQ